MLLVEQNSRITILRLGEYREFHELRQKKQNAPILISGLWSWGQNQELRENYNISTILSRHGNRSRTLDKRIKWTKNYFKVLGRSVSMIRSTRET